MPMKAVAVLIFVVLVGAASAGQAQAPARGAAPQAGRGQQANDPKRVIFEMQDSLGMLRGLQQDDSIRRIEYWGRSGSIAVQGRSVPIEKFRVSINYAVPGLRFDVTYGGKREIRVVSEKHAWNEDTPGGPATPMPAAVTERLLQLWLTPVGLAKSAAAAGAATKVSVENGATVLTFPIAGLTVKTMLNALYLPERVEIQGGAAPMEITYSDYADLNDVAKADVFLPRRIVHRQGAVTTMELVVETSNTNNPYVIMPVPENVAKAGAAGGRE
jgi:hypothetical protein